MQNKKLSTFLYLYLLYALSCSPIILFSLVLPNLTPILLPTPLPHISIQRDYYLTFLLRTHRDSNRQPLDLLPFVVTT